MEVLTTKEAANYLRLAENTLEKMRLTGAGPQFVRMGRAVRYTRNALENWMTARTVSSTSQQIAA